MFIHKKNYDHLSNKFISQLKDSSGRFAEALHHFVCPISRRMDKSSPPRFQIMHTGLLLKTGIIECLADQINTLKLNEINVKYRSISQI